MSTIDVYNQKANDFEQQYLSLEAKEVHASWLDAHLPSKGIVLDVGAGVGRDAKFFAEKGLDVVAVEPAVELRKRGQAVTKQSSVRWLDDTLPGLSRVYALQMQFDLIVLSAVWMHLPPTQRERAFRKLTNLLKPGGKLIISLRHGVSPDERDMWSVSVDELRRFAQQLGVVLHTLKDEEDKLERPEVWWETAVLELPDDGSGGFPVIRNILINDAKSATYKLALIRTLLRIADGHPGAVIERTDGQVVLPLGLVALYWARQYKPLLDAGLQQNSVSSRGLGFVKEDGWQKLDHISPQDFAVGQRFTGDEAQAMHKTLKDIAATIKNNPAKFITWSGSQNAMFDVAIHRTSNNVNQLYLDLETLKGYGEFAVPASLWQTMTQYACWVEPVAIQEWAHVTQAFERNKAIPLYEITRMLAWIEAERSTTDVRKRVEALQKANHKIQCVWSRKTIKQHYAIDHCLPFSRWPNNDLWNLLPTDTKVNLQKSDKVPSSKQLEKSKAMIVDWWQCAWLDNDHQRRTFFTQAELSLPGLRKTHSYDDVYESLRLQSVRLIDQQQLPRFDVV